MISIYGPFGRRWNARCCSFAESDILTLETAEQMKRGKPDVMMVELKGVGHAPSLMEESQISLIRHWLSLNQAWFEARTA